MKYKESKYFKITVFGTEQERADQFKLLTEFSNTEVEEIKPKVI